MEKDWDYAVVNGFTGTFSEYVTYRYECYCNICYRCDSKPMSFDEWVELGE